MYSKLDLKTHHFGLHLMFDGYGCPFEKLASKEIVQKTLNKLVRDLAMRKLTEPLVLKAPGNIKKDPGGFSGFLIIAESHISIHTFHKRGFVSVDIYSCKDFNVQKAITDLKTIFKTKKEEINLVIRGREYPEKNIYK